MYYLNVFYYNIFCKCYEPLNPLAHLFLNRPFSTENGFWVVLLQQTDLTILKQIFFSKVFSTDLCQKVSLSPDSRYKEMYPNLCCCLQQFGVLAQPDVHWQFKVAYLIQLEEQRHFKMQYFKKEWRRRQLWGVLIFKFAKICLELRGIKIY